MGYDTFAREPYCIGEYGSEAETRAEMEKRRRMHEATQDESLRDEMWILPPDDASES
jgi:hypothetical protein